MLQEARRMMRAAEQLRDRAVADAVLFAGEHMIIVAGEVIGRYRPEPAAEPGMRPSFLSVARAGDSRMVGTAEEIMSRDPRQVSFAGVRQAMDAAAAEGRETGFWFQRRSWRSK